VRRLGRFLAALMYKIKMSLRLLSAVLFLLIGSPYAWAEDTIRLAVAANFAAPLKHIVDEYSHQTGEKLSITISSSGTLYAQIIHGANFDVFFSADTQRPRALIDAGRISESDVVPYAQGRLAFVTHDHAIIENGLTDENVNTLLEQHRLAIANPKLAPYGVAAQQALVNLGLWEDIKPSLVMGKNVQQTYQFFTTKNVGAALVAYSLVKNSAPSVLVPDNVYSPIVQSLAILTPHSQEKLDTHTKQEKLDTHTKLDTHRSKHERVKAFVDYVLSVGVQDKLVELGYKPVLPVQGAISE